MRVRVLIWSHRAGSVLPSRPRRLPLDTMILRRSSRTDPRLVLGTALAFALPLGANPAALAQTPPAKAPVQAPAAPGPVPYLAPQPAPPGSPPTDADALKQRDQELEAARARAARVGGEPSQAQARDRGARRRSARKLNQQLIDTAARVRGVEASIEATEGRLKPLDEQEQRFFRNRSTNAAP